MTSIKGFLFLMFFVCLHQVCLAQNDFKSNKLRLIAKSLGLIEQIDTLPDGSYSHLSFYDNRPTVITIRCGMVEHIGLLLFSDSVRSHLNSPALDFIERYTLETLIPIDTIWTRSTRMEIDKVRFRKGDFSFFKKLPNDSLYSFILNIKDRKYNLKWMQGNKICCEVEFPMHYDLIGGRDRIELENSLIKELDRDTCFPTPQKHIVLEQLEKDSLEGYYILHGGSFYSKGLSCNQYYTVDKDSCIAPYYERFHIVETLSNLFSIPNYTNKIVFNVKLQKYGLIYENFSIPVSQWIKFCIDQGCTPYFGIISINNDCTLECSLIMENRQLAYIHAMKIKLNYLTLENLEGQMDAELTCYIMTSKIKKLFKEYEI